MKGGIRPVLQRLAPSGYVFLVFLLFYASQALCAYWARLELLDGYSNTPYNRHSLVFMFRMEESGSVDFGEIAGSGKLSGCVVLRYNNGIYEYNEVMYSGGGMDGIQYGSFCFDMGEGIAAAGAESGYGVGDKIFLNGKCYVVTGILEKHISSAVNTGIFYSGYNSGEIPAGIPLVLTSKDKGKITRGYAALEELAKKGGFEIKKMETSSARYSGYVRYHEMTVLLFGILGVFCLGLILLLCYIWLRIKGPEIRVLYLLGYGHIRKKTLKEYLAAWSCAFLLSLGTFAATLRDEYCDFPFILALSGGILAVSCLCGLLACLRRYGA